jgi:hypothetical protein
MTDFETIIKIVFFAGIGIFIGFLIWHPSQNDYVSQEDYNKLYQDYQTLQQEHETLKKDMGNLILEFYGKNLTFDLLGIKKYRVSFCALQKYLTGKIPVISDLVCN